MGGRFFIDWVVEYGMKQILSKKWLILSIKKKTNSQTNFELYQVSQAAVIPKRFEIET